MARRGRAISTSSTPESRQHRRLVTDLSHQAGHASQQAPRGKRANARMWARRDHTAAR
jgi:hypothetical protein